MHCAGECSSQRGQKRKTEPPGAGITVSSEQPNKEARFRASEKATDTHDH